MPPGGKRTVPGRPIAIAALLTLLVIAAGGALAGGGPSAGELRALLEAHGVEALPALSPPALPPPDPALYVLGEALFFDPILSGNRDIACATCHHPLLATGDGLSLGLGTGTSGLGSARFHVPGRPFIARHAPELFNRGQRAWRVMFWDGRVMQGADGRFNTPAGEALPGGLSSVLAAQAMFPVTSPAEMRGFPGDADINGAENTLALLDDPALDPDYTAIWAALTDRLLAIPAYVDLFRAAFPAVPPEQIGFQHAAEAIAAYEAAAFAFTDSPFDRFLAGDDAALSDEARRGAWLFYGAAGCARCHAGPLLTDQAFHNVAAPQLGPGQEEEGPLDYGRGRRTHNPAERFAFRTPPLRNVALTAPYLHNGAYTTLEGAVRHMIAPVEGLRSYDPGQLTPELAANVWDDPLTLEAILSTLDPLAGSPAPLTDEDVAALLIFLEALTDPSAADLSALIPPAVPSGLPVGGR